jgi:hypothetical protein
VVVDGADKLRDGAKVIVRDNAAATPAPAPANSGAQPAGARGQAKQPATKNGQ